MTLNPDEQIPQKTRCRNAATPQIFYTKLCGLRQICRCPMTEPLNKQRSHKNGQNQAAKVRDTILLASFDLNAQSGCQMEIRFI